MSILLVFVVTFLIIRYAPVFYEWSYQVMYGGIYTPSVMASCSIDKPFSCRVDSFNLTTGEATITITNEGEFAKGIRYVTCSSTTGPGGRVEIAKMVMPKRSFTVQVRCLGYNPHAHVLKDRFVKYTADLTVLYGESTVPSDYHIAHGRITVEEAR